MTSKPLFLFIKERIVYVEENKVVRRNTKANFSVIFVVFSFGIFFLSSVYPAYAEFNFYNDEYVKPEYLTKPTFGIDHDTEKTVVKEGFRFNGKPFDITDNYHTPFPEQLVKIGEPNTFDATTYSEKGLMVQEFLFGVPKVGEAHKAELGVEVWFGASGEIIDVKVIQGSKVIDVDTLKVFHEKTNCMALKYNFLKQEPKCDTTTLSVVFLEPLKDKVMAIKAIDFEKRYQITYLNEGIMVFGKALSPMNTVKIPSPTKYEGLIKVVQIEKYSPFWVAEDDRIFEKNEFGSFKEINKKIEKGQDKGNVLKRNHSDFDKIILYEQKRALKIFDSNKITNELPESFTIYNPIFDRIDNEIESKMLFQAYQAYRILENSNSQTRW